MNLKLTRTAIGSVTAIAIACAIAMTQLPDKLFSKLGIGERRALASALNLDAKQSPIDPNQPLIFQPRSLGKDDEPERRQAGDKFGGSKCPSDLETTLTALVFGEDDKSFKTPTVVADPTLWFYVPFDSAPALSAEFVLIDKENNKRIYKATYPLTGTPGIVSISLPPILEQLDRDYRWLFIVICDPEDRAADLYVSGKVRRVEPSPSLAAPTIATPEERAFIYARNGLWYETITTLIEEFRPLNPEKAALRLTELLESVGIEGIEPSQIVPCCTPAEETQANRLGIGSE